MLSLTPKLFLLPNDSSLNFLFSNETSTVRTLHFPNKLKFRCSSASEQTNQNKGSKNKKTPLLSAPDADTDKPTDPVTFLSKFQITHKAFAQFLRERHKSLKDLKDEIFNRFLNLQELASGYELLGMHRHPQHRADFMEWAPGARYCAIVGDFNGWSPTEHSAREGHFMHDDYGFRFVIIDDKLREGEEADNLYFQSYNYLEDYDKGDSGPTAEEIFKKANDEYWEPGEDRYIKSRFEIAGKLYEQIFGPNGPQREDELEDIPEPEVRYAAWKEQHKDDPPSNLPPFDVIDDGKTYNISSVYNDPVWREKNHSKKPPIAYWLETRKGRKAWLKKYSPGIPHGSKYRAYLNTADGPLERVPG